MGTNEHDVGGVGSVGSVGGGEVGLGADTPPATLQSALAQATELALEQIRDQVELARNVSAPLAAGIAQRAARIAVEVPPGERREWALRSCETQLGLLLLEHQIKLSEAQREAVSRAVRVAAGIVFGLLDRGLVVVRDKAA